MPLLLLVSLIWAFSFGLIGKRLAGLDSTAVATLRLALALLVFLPFFRWRGLSGRVALRLALIGAVQFGAMYLLYLRAFADLPSFAVALFTVTTPLYVTLFDAALERRWQNRFALAALLAAAGAAVVIFAGIGTAKNLPRGLLLVQLSNLCFAAGQLAWRRERARLPASTTDSSVFALPYAGALAIAILAGSIVFKSSEPTPPSVVSLTPHLTLISSTEEISAEINFLGWLPGFAPTPWQWLVIAYLGILASGVCFFWWNVGASRVNAGTLAAFNNVKIPLAVACSLLFFGETADLPRLLLGGALMAAAVWVAGRK
jgi:drug/metabolite transporter (DMT)-like permease